MIISLTWKQTQLAETLCLKAMAKYQGKDNSPKAVEKYEEIYNLYRAVLDGRRNPENWREESVNSKEK